MNPADEAAKAAAPRDRRSAARLAAVQALYQIDIGGGAVEDIIAEFAAHRPGVESDEAPPLKTDPALFAEIARGAVARRDEIDALITGALAEGWTMERLELLLRAVLRAGAFELLARPKTPARVAINEYVDVAHAFFGAGVPGLVNGVLDRLAHALRADEFGPPREPVPPQEPAPPEESA